MNKDVDKAFDMAEKQIKFEDVRKQIETVKAAIRNPKQQISSDENLEIGKQRRDQFAGVLKMIKQVINKYKSDGVHTAIIYDWVKFEKDVEEMVELMTWDINRYTKLRNKKQPIVINNETARQSRIRRKAERRRNA